jgi:hypothetical protein
MARANIQPNYGVILMREFKRVEIVSYDEVPLAATCNRCGNHFTEDPTKPITKGWQAKIHNFALKGEYGSIYEGYDVQFDLCDNCLSELFETFKIDPLKSKINIKYR